MTLIDVSTQLSETPNSKKYLSAFGANGKITAAQYISELLCARQARTKNVELVIKFWNIPTWKRIFLKYVAEVNKILRVYDETAILKAINRTDCKWIWSLRNEYLLDAIQEEQEKLVAFKQKPKEINPMEEIEVPMELPVNRQPQQKNNNLNKLRRLE